MKDIKHGRSGYRRGCHCSVCRAGHAAAQKEYRARRAAREAVAQSAEDDGLVAPPPALVEPYTGETKPQLDLSCEPGPIESALIDELDRLIGEPPFKQTLTLLACYNARVLDQVPRMDRVDLISGVQSRLFNVFDRLRKVETNQTGPLTLEGLLPPLEDDEPADR